MSFVYTILISSIMSCESEHLWNKAHTNIQAKIILAPPQFPVSSLLTVLFPHMFYCYCF